MSTAYLAIPILHCYRKPSSRRHNALEDDMSCTKMTRRSVMAGAAAVPLAGAATVPALADTTGELARLIETHQRIWEEWGEAIARMEEVGQAYEAAYPGTVIAPCLLGGGFSLEQGIEFCKEHVARAFQSQRERLVPIRRLAPDLAEQLAQVLDAKEPDNMALVDQTFADEEAREEAFGFAAAKRECEELSDAADAAALAICAHPCSSPQEGRMKVEYISTAPYFTECVMEEEIIAALLQSIAATKGGAS